MSMMTLPLDLLKNHSCSVILLDCLVCGLTVNATNFAADSISTYGILWDSIHESQRTQERLTTKQQNERQTEEAYSFVIDQSIDDSGPDLASLLF